MNSYVVVDSSRGLEACLRLTRARQFVLQYLLVRMICLHDCSAQAPDHLQVQAAADIETDLMQLLSPLRQLDQRKCHIVEGPHHTVDNP